MSVGFCACVSVGLCVCVSVGLCVSRKKMIKANLKWISGDTRTKDENWTN